MSFFVKLVEKQQNSFLMFAMGPHLRKTMLDIFPHFHVKAALRTNTVVLVSNPLRKKMHFLSISRTKMAAVFQNGRLDY